MADRTPDLTIEGLAHDLNNLFETVQDVADLLAKDPAHGRLAARLERTVLAGTRILSSYVEQSQASLDLGAILDRSIESARDWMQATRRPQLEFIRDVDPSVRLRGHSAAWERVFSNLFRNAVQAMGESAGHIEIGARRSAEGISITVSDDGPGISPKVLPHVFEPRFSTRAKRSGLGLHIVKTIVEESGGTIAAANCPSGRGAQFRIELPAGD
ncbi:MAG: HAMP domain-containing sensor histidine kinase [Bryobacteraceae bacterium]